MACAESFASGKWKANIFMLLDLFVFHYYRKIKIIWLGLRPSIALLGYKKYSEEPVMSGIPYVPWLFVLYKQKIDYNG